MVSANSGCFYEKRGLKYKNNARKQREETAVRTYHLDDTERMIQNVLGNRREITVHGSSAFPCASYLDYYKKSAYPWHWHDEMEIAYIQEGEAEATIDGRK